MPLNDPVLTITDADGDTLSVYSTNPVDDLPSVQIDAQSYGEPQSGMVNYTPEQAPALAAAVLAAAGITEDPAVAAARERVREFLRQWRHAKSNHPTTVYSIYSDPSAEMADLLLVDLDLLVGGGAPEAN